MKLKRTGRMAKVVRKLLKMKPKPKFTIKKARRVIKKAKRDRNADLISYSGIISSDAALSGVRLSDGAFYYHQKFNYTDLMSQIITGQPRVQQLISLYEWTKLAKAKVIFFPYRRALNGLVNYQGMTYGAIDSRPEIPWPSDATIHTYRRDHKYVKVAHQARYWSMSMPSIEKACKASNIEAWQGTSTSLIAFYTPYSTDQKMPELRLTNELAISAPPVTVTIMGHVMIRYKILFKNFKRFT